ncbi:MAG TPA: hypothetical protein VGG74_19905 [Kofleriaceae bacterium]|jgi:hypothetical protein
MFKRAVLACLAISSAAYAGDGVTAASPIAGPPGSVMIAPPPPPPAPPLAPVATHVDELKKTNLQVSPVGVMFGFYSIAASRAVSSNVAISVELDAANTGGGSGTSTQAALSLPIYFKRTFSGPFFEPGVFVHEDFGPADAGVEMMVGWTYLVDSGLNISGAIGVSRRIDNDGEDVADSLGATGYFRVGYAF